MRFAKVFVGVTLLALMNTAGAAQNASPAARFVSGEIIVKFRPGATASAKADVHRQSGGERRAEINRTGVQLVGVLRGDESAAIARYQRNPNVLYAEPNFLRSIPEPASHPTNTEVIPGDYYFAEQYALHNTGQVFGCFFFFCYMGTPDADIDAPEAWAISTGTAIRVAVIDSGIDYNHPDLAGKVVGGYDFLNGDEDPIDDLGHGTHVAGTIAAAMNNPTGDPAREEGVVGVAPNAHLLAYKVCGVDGSCSDFAIQQALARAVVDGAKVVNMSLGSSEISNSLNDAVQNAWNAGVVIVAGAGNGGVTTPFYPAAFENVISVAAFGEDHRRPSFSNYGNWVDIAAPGNVIMSSYAMAACAGSEPVPGDTGCYTWISGTSMATPHVAGAAALVWSRADVLAKTQVVEAILESADPQGVDPFGVRLDSWTIHGGLNLYNALTYAVANRAPVANAGGPYSAKAGEVVSFDGRASSDPDNDALIYVWDFGDGFTDSGPTPTHTYPQPGTYQVQLTVDDPEGASDTTSTTAVIVANQPPTADAGLNLTVVDTDGNGEASVTLNASGSSDGDGTLVSYEWREGTQLVGSGVTPLVSFAVGTHNVTLTVTDNNAATATDQVVITVQAPVTIDTVAITKATYASRQRQLTVEATSSGAPGVTLTVWDISSPSNPILVGPLSYNAKRARYVGTLQWPTKPSSIRVVSSGGGAATSAVGGR